MRQRRRNHDRDHLDRYYTPAFATMTLLHYMGGRISGQVLECCYGRGHIARVLQAAGLEVDGIDVDPLSDCRYHGDFIEIVSGPNNLPGYAWVISNPPYEIENYSASDFVRAALEVGVVGVAMLLRVGFLEPTRDREPLLTDLLTGAGATPTDLIILPRVHYIDKDLDELSNHNNSTSVWVIYDRRRMGEPPTFRIYPQAIRADDFDWSKL